MKKTKEIWIGEKDLTRDPEFIKNAGQEFVQLPIVETLAKEETNLKSNRRDFLKYLGFGITAATIASCETPINKAIPYVIKPDEIVPGIANYYASSFVNGGDYCPILVKTREGRPIKIEGNPLSKLSQGGTSARAQATVLSLYDTNRFKNPKIKEGENLVDTNWADLDKAVKSNLATAGSIRILSNTILSPTAKKAVAQLKAKYSNVEHIMYDPISSSAQLDANQKNFGQRVIPNYHFDKADVIVGIDADFLGTWISPVEFAADYATHRKVDAYSPKMSRHYQVESYMSLTGTNADNRIPVKPSALCTVVGALYKEIVGGSVDTNGLSDKENAAVKAMATDLKANKGKSLVVCGINNIGAQVLVNKINDVLGNIGSTMDFGAASLARQGDDKKVQTLIQEMSNGSVDALIVMDANPAYDLWNASVFTEAAANVKTKISTASLIDETAAMCDYIAPANHILESWGDVEAKRGHFGLIQPTISPLFSTRQAEESLLVWADSAQLDKDADQPYYEFLKKNWSSTIFGQQSSFASFQGFWKNALHDGVTDGKSSAGSASFSGETTTAIAALDKIGSTDLEITFTQKVGLGAGQYANNPWLQEMPDPITRCTWGNYLAIPVDFDGVKRFEALNGLDDGDLVEVSVGGKTLTVPVIRQFGQPKNSVALAMGYGREGGDAARGIGVNVMPMLGTSGEGYTSYYAGAVTVSKKIGEEKDFSCVQYHHTMGIDAEGVDFPADEKALVDDNLDWIATGYKGALTNRSIIRRTELAEMKEFVPALIEERAHHEHLNEQTLYPYEEYVADKYSQGHHWGMHIDMNACIGCAACTVACMAENNVPVVGKHEVSRHHEMTWLRIDRYYYGDIDSPSVVYQPMMCQHCDNAPCENVCPVNASNHSSEGLNQMAYNRCVGTRYCANNCPYKVRRFNWLDYQTADLWPENEPRINGEEIPFGADNLTRMVLNPDVTVRSRGVIEKCSFCVQRIQEGKLTAKKEMRRLQDSDVKTACQTACPTGAITFGDTNNKEGALHKKLQSDLNYIVLEEVNVRSSVNYKARVINPNASLDA